MSSTTERFGRRAFRVAAQPVAMGVLLLGLYAVLSLGVDPGGYLGTDTGAKVATLDHMDETGTWRPNVGYWAEEWDPAGDFHPLVFTKPNDRGEWVNVTTLPMLLAARPLYAVGGYRLALLLPMLGAVAAAYAGRDLARQVGTDRDGTAAFWVVGVASPVVVYALDFWEHAPGVALMAWAVALLCRSIGSEARWWHGLVAGALFGSSATMRTESFVVGFVAVGGACLAILSTRRVGRALSTGALAVVGFAPPWILNGLLEQALGGRSRAGRASAQASGPLTDIDLRIREAFQTWFGFPAGDVATSVISGVLIVSAISIAIVLIRRGEVRSARLAVAVALGLALVGSARGFAFVPGALVASPVAALLIAHREWDLRKRYVLSTAVLATVLIWATQYTGGAGPQWGGRYLLAPTLLLTVLGVLAFRSVPRWLASSVAALALGISMFGVGWLYERSHAVDRFFAAMVDRPEDVIIVTNGFLTREGGAAYDDRRLLSMGPGGDLTDAMDVVRGAGLDTASVLTSVDTPLLGADDDVDFLGVDEVDFLGSSLYYQRYSLDDS